MAAWVLLGSRGVGSDRCQGGFTVGMGGRAAGLLCSAPTPPPTLTQTKNPDCYSFPNSPVFDVQVGVALSFALVDAFTITIFLQKFQYSNDLQILSELTSWFIVQLALVSVFFFILLTCAASWFQRVWKRQSAHRVWWVLALREFCGWCAGSDPGSPSHGWRCRGGP